MALDQPGVGVSSAHDKLIARVTRGDEIEQPIGLAIPRSVLIRADPVIDRQAIIPRDRPSP